MKLKSAQHEAQTFYRDHSEEPAAAPRIQSLPGKRILCRTISASMQPTDHMSTSEVDQHNTQENAQENAQE